MIERDAKNYRGGHFLVPNFTKRHRKAPGFSYGEAQRLIKTLLFSLILICSLTSKCYAGVYTTMPRSFSFNVNTRYSNTVRQNVFYADPGTTFGFMYLSSVSDDDIYIKKVVNGQIIDTGYNGGSNVAIDLSGATEVIIEAKYNDMSSSGTGTFYLGYYAPTSAEVNTAASYASNAANAANAAKTAADNAYTAAYDAKNNTWDSTESKSAAILAKEARDKANQALTEINNLKTTMNNIQSSMAPQIQKITGLNGATCTRTTTFTVIVQASSATQYRVKLDNGSWGSWTAMGTPTTVTVSTTGAHTIYVEVQNAFGTTASGQMTFFKI